MTVDIRAAVDADRDAITSLLRRSLGAGDDPRYEAFLEWKHRENPFGRSFEWVATIDGAVVGYRSFLRWQLAVDGAVAPAVRAVDTATDPDHQGKGIFRSLTLHAVEEMTRDGVAWVFNTPNDASRPGYLTMGWVEVGAPPVAVLPRSPSVLPRLRRARQAADRWSEPIDAFEPAVVAIADLDADAADPVRRGWTTHRTPAFLRWRYGHSELHYRAVRIAGGAVIFRVRRRGPLREVLIADAIGVDDRTVAHAARAILRATKADVAVLTGGRRPPLAARVRGPRLTWRPLADGRVPTLDELRLGGGDLELF